MRRRIFSNWTYFLWFLFYFIGFSILTAGLIIIFYIISVPLAFSPLAEILWRGLSGVRPLRLKQEKKRLLPLFSEVYKGAIKTVPKLSRKIRLYIQEDMSINAFAFGKRTLVLTRGSLELLDDECLKGLIAHELGHFYHYDTITSLFATVSNLFLTLLVKLFTKIKSYFDKDNIGFIESIFKFLFDLLYYIVRSVEFVGDLLLMRTKRKHEYLADAFALHIGFGQDLTKVLLEIYGVSIEKPKSVKEHMNSSHPHITKRIERLEKVTD